MSVEGPTNFTKLNKAETVVNIAVFAGVLFSGVLVQRIEHTPELAAQLPSFLSGRISDGMAAFGTMPLAKSGAAIYSWLANNFYTKRMLSDNAVNFVNDQRFHAAGVFGILSLDELSQEPLSLIPYGVNPSGTFDVGDIAAFGIGALGWIMVNNSAQRITTFLRNTQLGRRKNNSLSLT